MYYIGIDIANLTFTATALTTPQTPIFMGQTFENAAEGFQTFRARLTEHAIAPTDALIVMEATGVYVEQLCHDLYAHHFAVHVEPARAVRRAFRLRHKTDRVDSLQIAEYGFRFRDQLHLWTPTDAVLEAIGVCLTQREALSKVLVASKNAKRALQRKHQPPAAAIALHDHLIQTMHEGIKTLDQQMKAELTTHPVFAQHVAHVMSIPGVGFLLAVNVMLMTRGFREYAQARHLASYIGICPFDYESGTSVKRPARSDKGGSVRCRKLLYLAAMSLSIHHADTRRYYQRKLAEGKDKPLVLNNIANKLLKIICRVLQDNRPYIAAYTPFPPQKF